MDWSGWGDPARRRPLPESLQRLLEQALGMRAPSGTPVAREEVRLPSVALTAKVEGALAAVVGEAEVHTDVASRLAHAGGKSTPDLLRRRLVEQSAPDAVVRPGSHDEVVDLLRVCAEGSIAVVPFGGGTSVVGGVQPARDGHAAVVALDVGRLDRLVEADKTSMTARLEPGLRGPEAERLLGGRGLTLGHFPQSFEYATIGGFAATRSSGQASSGYGRFDEMVVGLRLATPRGTLELGRAPASAAGPDLRQLVLGSEGAFGVITEVTVRVHAVPEECVDEAWRFADFGSGVEAFRRLAQAGRLPTIVRLSDEAETFANLAMADDVGGGGAPEGGCLAILGFEGDAERVAASRGELAGLLEEYGGSPLGTELGARWREGRYSAPYLRDAVLDAGGLVETLETATSWSRLQTTYAAVRDALTRALADQGTPPLVLCHVSHVYPTGASLYFTVAAAQGADPISQWVQAKTAASDAIAECGATISHHHAVGLDHRDWMEAEIGELGIEVLRAVKNTLDPDGILNPGKLVPPA
ncbi:MAG: FAD-binding protein [Propionibacteriales bacterium]|nr:FAD-binding protein [Propionibacteriales bacterium]